VNALLFAMVALGLVALLQVALDRRARRAPKLDRVYLHLEKPPTGPVICDQDGRRLGKVRLMRYEAKLDAVDTIFVEVLAHDGEAFFMQGRRVGGRKP
jgi:hypothetical protein